MNKVSLIVSILVLSVFFVILFIAEFLLADHEHASIYLDPYKKNILEKYETTDNPALILGYMNSAVDNQPFVYRQTFFMALFGSILVTNFLFIMFPFLKIEHFFPVFFVLIFVMFIEFAFINFHYYHQKEDMVKQGITKLRQLMEVCSS